MQSNLEPLNVAASNLYLLHTEPLNSMFLLVAFRRTILEYSGSYLSPHLLVGSHFNLLSEQLGSHAGNVTV